MIILSVFFYLILVLSTVLIAFYFERKIPAFIQDRMGPMETGKYGILQGVADLVKLIQKEDIRPRSIDPILFLTAPFVLFFIVFAAFAVVPISSGFQGAMIGNGLFFVLAILSLDAMGLLMAGWGSNNKFSLYGAMRAVSQLISYEIPLGISVLCVVITCQTLDLQEICYQQGTWIHSWASLKNEKNFLFGINALNIDVTNVGGFLTWNIFHSPFLLIAFIIFFIASLAECNRAPFDLPEAENELIGGYHTEYSGFRFSIFFLTEYGMMLLVCLLATILFLGGWNTFLPNIGSVRLADWTSGIPGSWRGHLWGSFWLLGKAFFLILIQIWIRWTFPRLRADQLVYLCWKVLIPFALGCLFISALWKVWSV